MGVEIADDLGGPYFYVVLVSAFALSALSLMAVGLFAVLAYQITRQRLELGVRQAIGATRLRVLFAVVGRGLRPVAVGLLLGGLGSLPVTRILSASLYGVPAIDGVTLAGSVATVFCVAAAGAALSAVGALRIGPRDAFGGV
jgi:ABC-type antimicrobial peptide transport system permease subunit